MKISTTLLLLFILNFVTAQQKIIDSLKYELNKSKQDTIRVLLLPELTRNYYLYKPDTAILFGQQAYELSQRLHYMPGEALSLNRIAAAYSTVGDYPKALKHFSKALKLSRELNDQMGIGRALNNLGDSYLTQGDYSRALSFFKKSKLAALNLHNNYLNAVTSLNTGMCYLRLYQYDSALIYFNNTYQIAKEEKYQDFDGDVERGFGEIAAARKNFSEALTHFLRSVSAYGEIDDKQDLSITYLSIATLYRNQKPQDSSIYYAKKSLSTSQMGS